MSVSHSEEWWTRQASNLRQSGYEPGALPTELRVQQRKICLYSSRLAREKTVSSAENFRKTRPLRPPPLPQGSVPDPGRAGTCPPRPSFLPQGRMTKNAAPSPRPARFRPQRRFPGRPVPKTRLPFPPLSPPPSLSPRLFPGVTLPESLRRRAGKLSPRPLGRILSSAALSPPSSPRRTKKIPPLPKRQGDGLPRHAFQTTFRFRPKDRGGRRPRKYGPPGGLVIDAGTRARGWEDILMRRTENMLFFRRPARIPRRGSYRAWKYSRGCAQAGQDSGASRPSCT